jgi:gluconolactonase
MDTHRVLADGLLFPEGPVVHPDGSILLVEIERRTITRIGTDGRVDRIAELQGGPNGLAIGPDGALYVCNCGGFLFNKVNGYNRAGPGVPSDYTGGWIERVDARTGASEMLYDRCGDGVLLGPNDLVFDQHGGFYFTDFGKAYRRSRDLGTLYYALADGSKIVEVARPLLGPNGVGLSPDGRVVYVAETETARLWAFDLEAPGVIRRQPFPSPHGGRLVAGVPTYQRFDSMALEASGNICVATILKGCITVFNPAGEIVRQVPTSDPFTTNICFGGADMRTAYITLAGTGRLIAMDWLEPGLVLN